MGQTEEKQIKEKISKLEKEIDNIKKLSKLYPSNKDMYQKAMVKKEIELEKYEERLKKLTKRKKALKKIAVGGALIGGAALGKKALDNKKGNSNRKNKKEVKDILTKYNLGKENLVDLNNTDVFDDVVYASGDDPLYNEICYLEVVNSILNKYENDNISNEITESVITNAYNKYILPVENYFIEYDQNLDYGRYERNNQSDVEEMLDKRKSETENTKKNYRGAMNIGFYLPSRQKYVDAKNNEKIKSGKDISNLPNKKNIKDPKKASLVYKGRDLSALAQRTKNGFLVTDPETDNKVQLIDYNVGNKGKTPEEKKTRAERQQKLDQKELQYLYKHMGYGGKKITPEEAKKFQAVHRMFLNRHGIPGDKPDQTTWPIYGKTPYTLDNTSYIAHRPVQNPIDGEQFTRGRKPETEEEKKADAEIRKATGGAQGLRLPSGYWLVHQSPINGLKELSPQNGSARYSNDRGLQIHSSGRIYATIRRAGRYGDCGIGDEKGGNHFYRIISPVKTVYLDNEKEYGKNYTYKDNYDLENKWCYIKTDRPLKVQQLA